MGFSAEICEICGRIVIFEFFSGLLAEEFSGPVEERFVQRRIFLAAQAGKLLQFFPLLGVQTGWHFHDHAGQQVAPFAPVHVDDSLSPQLEGLAALRPAYAWSAPASLAGGASLQPRMVGDDAV